MAAYAIMRCKKLSSMGTVAAALQHAFRERETPNADSSRTPDNEHRAASSTNEAMGRLRELLPAKHRKDAVLAVEYVMTASPEWWTKATSEQQADFFDQAHKWLADKYGADRIITATVHRDELTPHLSAFVVPLTQDGRLSAKAFVGSRAKMSADQTSFARAVQHLGLGRGIEGSRAKHQRVRSYYGAIERQPAHVTITPQALEPRVLRKRFFSKDVETAEAVAARLTAAVREGYGPTVAAAAGARQEREKARQAQETARQAQERLQVLQAELMQKEAELLETEQARDAAQRDAEKAWRTVDEIRECLSPRQWAWVVQQVQQKRRHDAEAGKQHDGPSLG